MRKPRRGELQHCQVIDGVLPCSPLHQSICGIAEQIKLELEEPAPEAHQQWKTLTVSGEEVQLLSRRSNARCRFKPNLPLVTGLRNEGMRQRHWAS